MRVWGIRAGMAALTAVLYVTLHGQAPDATQVLHATREALGGEKKLSAIKSFTATGRTRQVRGNNLVPIEFELNVELPDKYIRIDEFPAQDADPTTQGFAGEDLIQIPAPPPERGGPPSPAPGRGGPAPNPTQARVVAIKQDFVRLTLGMFAASFSSYPLTFKYVAEGEAPEGKADILGVSGPANFSAQLVIQRDTHLPVMLMWQLPATNAIVRIPGQPLPSPLPSGAVIVDVPAPPAATATKEERDQYVASVTALRRQALAQAKPIDYRVYYGDFLKVDGLMWPFRLRRAIAGETVEETTVDRFRINPPIDPKRFEASK